MTKKLLVIGLFVFCSIRLNAQQEVMYTQYMFNALAFNPGYAGNKDMLSMNITYRNQWTKLKGAPRTMLFSIEKGIPDKNLGLGFHIVRDEIGAQKTLSPFLSTAYRIHVSEKTTLAMGIAFGFTQYQLDGTQLVVLGPSDPAVPTVLASTLLKDAKFGLYLNNDNFYLGLSAANLFNNNIDYLNNGTPNIVVPQRLHYFLSGGYIFKISEKIKCYPSFLIKENKNVPTNADINAFFLFNEKVWVGGSYRTAVPIFSKDNLQSDLVQRANAAASIQIYPTPGMRVGYSYDFNIAGLNNYFGGSHELSIGYALIPPKITTRMVSPRYY